MAQSIRALAKGGDSRSKGASTTLGLLLFRSLPEGKHKLLEKYTKAGELIVDPEDDSSLDQSAVVESVISLVAKDTASDSIWQMAALNKKASTCVRSHSESVAAYIERFTESAQGYINLTNRDLLYVESQNFAMMLLSNENLAPTTFSSVMYTLVQATKSKVADMQVCLPLSSARAEDIILFLPNAVTGKKDQCDCPSMAL